LIAAVAFHQNDFFLEKRGKIRPVDERRFAEIGYHHPVHPRFIRQPDHGPGVFDFPVGHFVEERPATGFPPGFPGSEELVDGINPNGGVAKRRIETP